MPSPLIHSGLLKKDDVAAILCSFEKKKKNGVTLTKTKFLVYARVFCIQKKKTQVYKRGKKWHIYLDAGEYIIDKKKKYALFSVFIDLLYERNTYKLRPGLTLVYNNNILRFHSRPRTRVYIYIWPNNTRISRRYRKRGNGVQTRF